MATTLTTTKLLDWVNASTGATNVIASTPDSDTLSLIQDCITAADLNISAYCNIPATYPDDVELAILMYAARLWDRRKTSNGLAMGEFGFVRVGSFDPDIERLLEPYRRFSFGVSE